ncbi:hypothetical protein B0T14DRAFT_566493 [Immersiella caudata]|uniref:Uncharacterized protein n=1 Tax=Immersiella caudata TaxID=314043 RepID=A0AA39WQU2_9PEZI|nr:hypothetical protein B0T14DRAFT_566493 [Immersiella caudata]
MADRGNREWGLKAAINNPLVSEQVKQRDREILGTEFGEHFEEGISYRKATAESASPEPEMSSGLEGFEEDMECMENPPPRVKQTTGLRSAATPPVSKSSKMSSSEMMESSSSSKPTKIRSSSAGPTSSRIQEIGGKDAGNVIRGLKAAITNPNVSEKAKEKNRKKLRELGESVD